MVVLKRCLLAAAMGAASLSAEPKPATTRTTGAVASIEALQGSIVRWSVPGTKRCGMGGRSWAALQETCYYPIDVLHAIGLVKVSRQGVGPAAFASISVRGSAHDSHDIELGDIAQANPSKADLRRSTRDQALLAKLWAKREGSARFTLPLGAPAPGLPEPKGFGAKWVFNGRDDAPEIHTGVDYALAVGAPVVAFADGTVAVAEDLFYMGKAVFVDHGTRHEDRPAAGRRDMPRRARHRPARPVPGPGGAAQGRGLRFSVSPSHAAF